MRDDYRYVLLYYILLGFIISLVTLLIRYRSLEPIKISILTIIIALILYIIDLYTNNTYNLGLSNM